MSEYLTYEERLEIEACLKESLSFGEIGRKLGKDRTTIAKEIKRHSYEKKTGYSGCTYNACIHRLSCKVKDICGKAKCKRPSAYNCRLCSYCNDICPDFEEQICTALFKPPYVCNACVQYNKCTLSIEYGPDGLLQTKIFYCDPSAPYQKGSIEVNHELVRRIIPKGSSFDGLTQDDVFLMMNHINSYKRKKLNNRSPYDAFSFYHGEELLHQLGCSPVNAENIILKPRLLKK